MDMETDNGTDRIFGREKPPRKNASIILLSILNTTPLFYYDPDSITRHPTPQYSAFFFLQQAIEIRPLFARAGILGM